MTCDSVHAWRPYNAAHCKTGPPAPCPDIPLSHIFLTLSQPVLVLSYNAERLAGNQQVYILLIISLTRAALESSDLLKWKPNVQLIQLLRLANKNKEMVATAI